MNYLTGYQNAEPERSCKHSAVSDEELQKGYLNEYNRFIQFTSVLHGKLTEAIPQDFLTKSLFKSLESMKLSDQEKKLFNDQNVFKEFLKDPLLEIALSFKELEQIDEEQKHHIADQCVDQSNCIMHGKKPLKMSANAKAILKSITMSIL